MIKLLKIIFSFYLLFYCLVRNIALLVDNRRHHTHMEVLICMALAFSYKHVLRKLKLIIDVCAEGAGSLLSLLKAKGWATGLSAGVGEGGYDHSSAGYMFSVNIWLTDSGLEHVNLGALTSFILSIL